MMLMSRNSMVPLQPQRILVGVCFRAGLRTGHIRGTVTAAKDGTISVQPPRANESTNSPTTLAFAG